MSCSDCGEIEIHAKGRCKKCYGVDYQRKRRRAMGIPERRIMTEADVKRIRLKPRTGEDKRRLAGELGVTVSMIYKICSGLRRKHVT